MEKGIKVLLVGSCPDGMASDQKILFQKFCENLGRWLVADHCVLLCGVSEKYADYHVFQGMYDEWGKRGTYQKKLQVKLFKTENDENDSPCYQKIVELQQSGRGPVVQIFRGTGSKLVAPDVRNSEYKKAGIAALKESDMLIVVGGGSFSQQIYTEALNQKRPVLIFSGFGGTSKMAIDEYSIVYEILGLEVPNLIKESSLDQGRIILNKFIFDCIKVHPFSRRRVEQYRKKNGFFFISAVLISALTFFVPVYGGSGNSTMALFMMFLACCSSATVGSAISSLENIEHTNQLPLILIASKGLSVGLLVFAMSVLPLLAASGKFEASQFTLNPLLQIVVIANSLIWSLVVSSEKALTGERLLSIVSSISKIFKAG